MKKLLIAIATLAVSAGIALGGAAPAQANPSLCWNGYVLTACLNAPNWGWGWDNHWNPGHGWNDWKHSGKHGHWK